MGRRQLFDAAIDRARIRNIAKGEKFLDRLRVEPTIDGGGAQDRLQLRGEDQPAIGEKAVVERLFAEAVAREEQRLAPLVEERKGEHPVEALETRLAPLLPGMNDDLGIAARSKHMAERGEFGHQRLEIINLAVEHDADRAVFVEQRLIAARQVDDGEAAMPEPDPGRMIKPVPVRATMGEQTGHPMQQEPVGRAAPAVVEDAGDPAHKPVPSLRIRP